MNPQSFLDDIMRVAEDVENAQYGIDHIEEMMTKKVLELNVDKYSFVIIGKKKDYTSKKQRIH